MPGSATGSPRVEATAPLTNGGVTLAGPGLVDPRLAYDQKWQRAGQGLYNEGKVAGTPLLGAMIGRLASKSSKLTVVEAAAGSGDQALYLARQLLNTEVIAIDTSPTATRRIRERTPSHEAKFGVGSKLTVITGDAHTHLAERDPASLDGFHANSFFHFLTGDERATYLATLHRTLTVDGLVAVSFKAAGDALLSHDGTTVVEEDDQAIQAIPPDGIQRLFVKNLAGVEAEFADAGLRVVERHAWEVAGYDIPGQDSKFVSVLAERAA